MPKSHRPYPPDADALVETTIKSISNSYYLYKSQAPERDRHFWLAAAFMNRPGYRVGQDVGALVPFTKTSLYSVLEDDRAAEALAYYFLSQETPHVAPKFETRWAAIMRPATDLVHRGRFAQKWEETNPWTAKSILGIREGVAALDDTAKD